MNLMTTTFFLTLIFVVSALAQTPCKEYSAPEIAFAFCVPDGLSSDGGNGSIHNTFVDNPDKEKSRKVLLIQQGPFEIESAKFAFQLAKVQITDKMYPNLALVEAIDFETDSGLTGTKIAFLFDTKEKTRAKQIWYILDTQTDVQLQFTALSKDIDPAIDEMFDAAIRSVRLKAVE